MDRPADLAADHARLGRLPHSGAASPRYDAPVWVDNDVNVLALGEWRSGVAPATTTWWSSSRHGHRRRNHLGRRLHRGAQGSAGDVGHIQVVDDRDVVCRCGNVGCLEALAGGAALGRDGEAAAREGRSLRLREALDRRGAVTAEDVARAARSATRSRSSCSRRRAGGSARCSRAS